MATVREYGGARGRRPDRQGGPRRGGGRGADCDGASYPRPPIDPRTGCPRGDVQCQQELSTGSGDNGAYATLVSGATDTLQFTPYRAFTPISLWNAAKDISGTARPFHRGLVMTSVLIGTGDQIKGDVSLDAYLPTVDRGHDVHWDQFTPTTPLRMAIRNDGADASVLVSIKGAAYRV